MSDAEPGGMYKCDGKLHENRRDVAKFVCSNKDGEVDVHIALIGIENQTNVFYLMPVRCFEYDAANYRKQLTATKDLGKKASDKVIPIVTLVLYFGKSPWTGPTTLKQCLDKKKYPKEFEPYLNDYKIHVFDIPRLSEKQVDMFQSDFRIAADYFRKRIMGRTNFMQVMDEDDRYEEILVKLDSLDKKEGINMCYIFDDAEKKGIEKGIEQGTFLTLMSLVKDGIISRIEAAKRMNISEEEFESKIRNFSKNN